MHHHAGGMCHGRLVRSSWIARERYEQELASMREYGETEACSQSRSADVCWMLCESSGPGGRDHSPGAGSRRSIGKLDALAQA